MIPAWVEPTCFLLVGVYLLGALRDPAARGARLRRFLLLALAGFLGEASCVRLYGFYTYAPGWRLSLDVVPLAVVLVWPVVILSALDLARELTPAGRPLRAAALCAALVFADAALIEPVAVRAGLWAWHAPGIFEVPPIGVLGWSLFAGITSAWFAWLEASGGRALSGGLSEAPSPPTGRRRRVLRRAELALAPLAPVALHLALLVSWWGLLRWVDPTLPGRYGVALAWSASFSAAAWALRAAPARFGTLLARAPGALVFFVLLVDHGDAALRAYALAFPLPYLVLCARALRGAPAREPSRTRTRRALRWAALGLVLAWDAFLLGPVPEVDTRLREPGLPAELARFDAYLEAQEARFDDVTPGAEKAIVWANPAAPARTPLALVYLHGFSATRQETAPLCDEVAKRLGANLYYPRLAGHGRGAALGEATVNAWLNDSYEAYRIGQRLGERVVLVGTSTGGTLAVWLAARPDIDLAALVLISPNFAVRAASASLLLAPWGGQLAELVVGPEVSWRAHNEAQARFWTTRYPTRSLLPLAGLMGLVAETDLAQIRAPSLLVVSPDDGVVDPAVARARFAEVRAPTRVIEVQSCGDPSRHVLAGEILGPDDTEARVEELLAFLREVARVDF
ncbi:MAG: carotenoid biosynthesis protein [Planctomycetes bacterium]|nr:carotenoid biosynthesis protein [Planctomycetota bacterium]